MDKFKSHKIVEAAVIVGMTSHGNGTVSFILDEKDDLGRNQVINAPADIISRYQPKSGDYLVKYSDDYMAISPKDAFRDGYTCMEPDYVGKCLTFGTAIEFAKAGRKIARAGWNGKGIFVELQKPDENSKMTSPYLYIDTTGLETDNETAPKSRVPWLASQTDMLASDWMVVE